MNGAYTLVFFVLPVIASIITFFIGIWKLISYGLRRKNLVRDFEMLVQELKHQDKNIPREKFFQRQEELTKKVERKPKFFSFRYFLKKRFV